MDPHGFEITIWDEVVVLLPQRAVYWPRLQTLMVADLHWGKSETFQAHGIPVSNQVFYADLDRLALTLFQTHAQRLVILGDLIHQKQALQPPLIKKITTWRAQFPHVQMQLVRGNHDRFLDALPESWQISLHEAVLYEAPFALTHDTIETPDHFVWSGHLHPTFRFGAGRDALRLRCFQMGQNQGILPAFSHFTGGYDIQRKPDKQIFVIAENEIIEV